MNFYEKSFSMMRKEFFSDGCSGTEDNKKKKFIEQLFFAEVDEMVFSTAGNSGGCRLCDFWLLFVALFYFRTKHDAHIRRKRLYILLAFGVL